MRFTLAITVSALVLSALGTGACGDGYSEDRANQVCTEEQTAKGAFFGEGTFAECVACHEECGDQCDPTAGSPIRYACADGDEVEGEGGAASE